MVKVGTLNINGVRKKGHEVQFLCEKEQLGCQALQGSQALQETLLRSTDPNLRVPGYRTFSVCGEHVASTTGVALLLRSDLNGYTVGASPWHIPVWVSGEKVGNPWIIGSLYIRSSMLETPPLKNVLGDIRKILREYSNDSLVLMVDCNYTAKRMAQQLGKTSPECVVLEPDRKGLGTRRFSRRCIDDIMVCARGGARSEYTDHLGRMRHFRPLPGGRKDKRWK